MKKYLTLLFVALLPLVANADETVEVDGIYYYIIVKSKIAEVTSNPNGYKYSMDVDIPASFVYGGDTYSVTTIGYRAFYKCSSLNSVSIPNSVTSIGKEAFQGCSRLTSVNIPNSVTSIEEAAFRDCSGLTSIVIPNSVTFVGWSVFSGCSSLISVSIPNSLNTISNYMFYKCVSLKSVSIPNSVTGITYYSFYGCKSLTSIEIPSNVTYIGDYTFMNCSSLTSVDIPNNVNSIGLSAFADCNLTFVKIGNNAKYIGSCAFASNEELTDVYCLAETVPIVNTGNYEGRTKTDIFKGSHIEDVVLHVPAASVNLYKDVEPWKSFKSIVGVEPETPKCVLPTISYVNGKLTFASETEGTECVATISDTDIKTHYGNEISLTATYTISVYATKIGYDNSDIATATLCWIDQQPATEGIIRGDAVTEMKALPVLIQTQGGTITIQGAVEGTPIAIYDLDGRQYSTALADRDRSTIATSLRSGSIAIVKIGERSVKVQMK